MTSGKSGTTTRRSAELPVWGSADPPCPVGAGGGERTDGAGGLSGADDADEADKEDLHWQHP